MPGFAEKWIARRQAQADDLVDYRDFRMIENRARNRDRIAGYFWEHRNRNDGGQHGSQTVSQRRNASGNAAIIDVCRQPKRKAHGGEGRK
jgi:hypothetical protein